MAEEVTTGQFGKCLRDFSRYIDPPNGDRALAHLRDRLTTYRTYHSLRTLVHAQGVAARDLLAERPFPFGRTLISVTNLAFLRDHFHFDCSAYDTAALEEYDSPERLAEAASTAIALANAVRPLDSADFTFPLTGLNVSPDFLSLLRYAAAMRALQDIGKSVALFGYSLVRTPSANGHKYELRPEDRELEYSIRLGYCRSEMGTSAAPLHLAEASHERLESMRARAEWVLEQVPALAEIRYGDSEFRRLRLTVPRLPQAFQAFQQTRFYEDALLEDRLAQELELPMTTRDVGPPELANRVGVETVRRVWRNLEVLAHLHIAMLRRSQGDGALLQNSLMTVIPWNDLAETLESLGGDKQNVRAVLNLLCADVQHLGFYDMQYRPLLVGGTRQMQTDGETRRIPREVYQGSAIVATANVIPNIQRGNRIRFSGGAEALVALVAEQMKAIPAAIRTNVGVKSAKESTEVDVVALTESSLYLMECKHSITATGPHELRDLWRDIGHGIEQLQRAMRILESRLSAYLAGWFPGTSARRAGRLTVRPCLVCSHRVFAGLTRQGIPVRDFASLRFTLGEATVSVGEQNEAGEVVLRRHRLRARPQVTENDLNEYLGEDSRYFRLFRPFMKDCERREVLMGGAFVIAHRTYRLEIADGEWTKHVESIGGVETQERRYGPQALRPRDMPRSGAAGQPDSVRRGAE